jgi:hypothetical protein
MLYPENPTPLPPNYQTRKITNKQPNSTHQPIFARKNIPSISPEEVTERMYKSTRNSTTSVPSSLAHSDNNDSLENLITNYTLKISLDHRKKKKAAVPPKMKHLGTPPNQPLKPRKAPKSSHLPLKLLPHILSNHFTNSHTPTPKMSGRGGSPSRGGEGSGRQEEEEMTVGKATTEIGTKDYGNKPPTFSGKRTKYKNFCSKMDPRHRKLTESQTSELTPPSLPTLLPITNQPTRSRLPTTKWKLFAKEECQQMNLSQNSNSLPGMQGFLTILSGPPKNHLISSLGRSSKGS